MLYWECKRRLAEMRSFLELVREYFSNTTFDTRGRRHAMTDLSELRTKINVMIRLARVCCRTAETNYVKRSCRARWLGRDAEKACRWPGECGCNELFRECVPRS